MKKRSVIIAGGGIGERMGADIPKQFLRIGGQAIILRSIECFVKVFPEIEIIVVLPEAHIRLWENLGCKYTVKIAQSGEERFHSVKNALQMATGELIAIHDAVRPFVAEKVIVDAFETAEVAGAVVPVIPVEESLRKIIHNESEAVPRGSYRIVQTPQVFKANIIKLAYEQPFHLYFTDDAAVVEACGHDIVLVDGNERNIKITTPFDLQIAEQLVLSEK